MNIVIPRYPQAAFPMSQRVGAPSDLIIHHTDGNPDQTPEQIDQEHRNIGDAMIAYNFIIGKDGTVYQGRPINFIPAAAFGRNAESVNVVLTGDFQPGTVGYHGPPTEAQVLSLKELCLYLHKQIPSIVRTIGHREVATIFYNNDGDYATACPGDDLQNLIPEIKKYVVQLLNVH